LNAEAEDEVTKPEPMALSGTIEDIEDEAVVGFGRSPPVVIADSTLVAVELGEDAVCKRAVAADVEDDPGFIEVVVAEFGAVVITC